MQLTNICKILQLLEEPPKRIAFSPLALFCLENTSRSLDPSTRPTVVRSSAQHNRGAQVIYCLPLLIVNRMGT